MNRLPEPLVTIDDAKQCAVMMSTTEPWITLKRGYDHSLRLFLDRSFDTYIIKDANKVIALCSLQTGCFPQPYIKLLAVDPACRGKGLGSFMIAEMERKFAYVNGKMFIAVSSFNDGARRLYTSLGYTETGELKDYAVEGHAELLMQKTITEKFVDAKPVVYACAGIKEMDIDFIYENLRILYWATNLTKENLIGRMLNSICFGVFADGKQKGFARVITDYFSFSYLADVFVEEASRGKGYGRLLMQYIMDYPLLKDQKWLLATRDMHRLYEKFGFGPVANAERFMGKNGWRSF